MKKEAGIKTGKTDKMAELSFGEKLAQHLRRITKGDRCCMR